LNISVFLDQLVLFCISFYQFVFNIVGIAFHFWKSYRDLVLVMASLKKTAFFIFLLVHRFTNFCFLYLKVKFILVSLIQYFYFDQKYYLGDQTIHSIKSSFLLLIIEESKLNLKINFWFFSVNFLLFVSI